MKFGEKKKPSFRIGAKRPGFKFGKQVKDISPIREHTNITVKTKEDLKAIVEEPCLKACENLFEKNIETVDSGCNGENSSHRAYVTINYDTLSEANQKIADYLVQEGKMQFYPKGDNLRNYFNQVEIEIPIRSNDFVVNVEKKLLAVVSCFERQDKIEHKKDFSAMLMQQMKQNIGERK